MSQQPTQFGQQAQSMEGRGRQSEFARDPASGRFLTDEERAQVQRLAQQYPQKVQQAYAQNIPLSAVGLQLPGNTGDRGSQVGGGMGQQGQQGTQHGSRQGGQQQGTWQGGQQQGGRQQGGWQQSQQPQTQQTQGRQMQGQQGQQQPQQLSPQQQQGYISGAQEPASNEPGWPGKQGRGADQGAADRRHSPEFRQRMSQIAQQRPRDPQTGQFLPQGQGGQQTQQSQMGQQPQMGQQRFQGNQAR